MVAPRRNGRRASSLFDASACDGGLHLGEAQQPLKRPATASETVVPAIADTRSAEQRLADLIAPLCGHASDMIAVDLLARFGSLSALFRARRRTLECHLQRHHGLVDLLIAVRPLVGELLKAEMLDAPVLPDNRAAIRYLHAMMAHEPAEQVRVLYLDAKNRILRDEVAARGSVTKTDIFPREIVRRALDLGATGLIMAHNHPSGDPEPSRHDLTATRAVADAAKLFDLVLHDHIVLGRGGYRSLREEGYL